MEIIQKELQRSKLYYELKEKYLMKKLRIVVLIGAIAWILWMYQILNAMTYYAGQKVIIFN